MRFILFICLILSIGRIHFSASASTRENGSPLFLPVEENGKVILDTFRINLEEVPPICIDQSVILTCDEKYGAEEVLEYIWTDKTEGKVVGNSRTIRVSPKTTTTYELRIKYILREKELIRNGDFEQGYKYFSSDYKLEPRNNAYNALWGEGKYKIATHGNQYHPHFWNTQDHTSGGGKMMVANGNSGRNVVVWEETITGIEPGTAYAFSAWGASLTDGHRRVNGNIVGWGQYLPIWQFSINGAGFGEDFRVQYQQWNQFFSIWRSGNATSARIALVDKVVALDGNDFALDDISFAPVKEGVGEVVVEVLPQVDLKKFVNEDLCEGDSLTINANATGSGTLQYKWFKISGQDSIEIGRTGSLSVKNADVDRDNGKYSCVVTGTCGSRVEGFTLNVREKVRNTGAKVDTVDVCVGGSVSLSADRCTGYNLAYQWRAPAFDWLKPGNHWLPYTADEVEYYKNGVNMDDAGKYRCVVTGQCGRDTIYSVVRIEDVPRLLDVSADTTVCPGETVKLFVTSDSKMAKAKWILPDLSVVEGNTFTVVAGHTAGIYRYILSGCAKEITGSVKVDVFTELNGFRVFSDTAVCLHGTAVFRAEAKGSGLKYSWMKLNGGETEVGERLPELVISDVSSSDTGQYQVTVKDTCGNVRKGTVHLSLLQEYENLQITEDRSLCEGEDVVLRVGGGKNGLAYQWILPDGTRYNKYTDSLPVKDFSKEKEGRYTCRIDGTCPGIEKEVNLTLKKKLTVSPTQDEFEICPGEGVRFDANADGEEVAAVWWRKGGKIGEGKSLTLMNPVAADTGIYECRINSACGDTVLYYYLQLREITRIVEHTPDKYLGESDPLTLYVNAIGTHNRYEWRMNGRIVGENSNRLSLPPFGEAGKGDYVFTCEVTGDCGTDLVTIHVYVRIFTYVYESGTQYLCIGEDYTYLYVPKLPVCPIPGDTTFILLKYNGEVYGNQSVASFPNFQQEQEGLYTWTAKNGCGESSIDLNIHASEVPVLNAIRCNGELVRQKDTIRVCENDNLHFVAEVADRQGVTYEWSYNGEVVRGATDSVLKLNGVTRPMAGTYACRIVNQCGETGQEFEVVVLKKLVLLESAPLKAEVCDGDEVVWWVHVNGETPVFTWSGPGREKWQMEEGGYKSYYRNSSVKREADNGTYVCHVESVCGSLDVRFTLDAEKILQLLDVFSDDTICRGSSVKLFVRPNIATAACVWQLPDGRSVSGGEYSIPAFGVDDAGQYGYRIQSRCRDTSGTIELALHKELGELKVSRDTAVCENETVRFSVDADGDRVEYSWRGPGGFASVEKQFTVEHVVEGDTGRYEVIATDICGNWDRRKVRLSLLEDLGQVSISRDTVVCDGGDLFLAVEHEGVAEYEWEFEGKKISENRKLELKEVTAADTGIYTCRLIGHCRTVEKKVHVGVYPNLSLTVSEQLKRVCPGENVTFRISAIGEKVRYVWSKDGREVGTRDSVLRLEDVIAADAGIYHCRVTSVCGSQEVDFELQVKKRTYILNHSQDRFVTENDSIRLVVRAEGENNVYKWWFKEELAGVGQELLIKDVGKVDTLYYGVSVRGDCGVDTSYITIKVGAFRPLQEIADPDTLCEGSTYTYVANVFPETCFGDENFEYKWTYNGEQLPVEGPLFHLSELTTKQGGIYECEIINECGKAKITWKVHVTPLPKVLSMTGDAFITEGAEHEIRAEMSGEELQYEWKKDQAVYLVQEEVVKFHPVKLEDQGIYRVTASNRCGSVFADSELKVWRKTTIVSPLEQTISACLGSDTVFRVKALGAVGMTYTWYHEGELLSVPAVDHLELSGLTTEDGGDYKCVVDGRGGKDSCLIHLQILELPKAAIIGEEGFCLNELTQEYRVESDEERIACFWNVSGGKIDGRHDLPQITVNWMEEQENRIGLEVISLTTGCSAKDERVLEHYPYPDISLVLPDTVGYCRDSLRLNQGYPSGGYYLVNGFPEETVRFTNKEKLYVVEYHYAERCATFVKDTIHIAPAPWIEIPEDTVFSGRCHLVELEISGHSAGEIRWDGKQELDVTDVLHPVFMPDENTPEDLLFRAELTDEYGCKASDEVIVSLAAAPRIYLGKDTVAGSCNEVVLKAEYYTPWLEEIEWTPAEKLQVLSENTVEVTDKTPGEEVFVAVVRDRFGCEGRDEMKVTIVGAPELNEEEACESEVLTVDCQEYKEFRWNDGFTDPVRMIRETGRYRLWVKDEYGCTAEADYVIRPLPVVFLPDTLIFEGEKMEYQVELNPDFEPYEIRWQDGSDVEKFVASEEGHYSVRVKDNIGCMAEDTAYLEVHERYIAAPDAFLPLSSGENSRFYLKEVNFVSRFEMYIYDRWGELVFKTNEIGFNGGWNGTFKGMDCLPGTYIWVAFADGKQVGRGTVMLVK